MTLKQWSLERGRTLRMGCGEQLGLRAALRVRNAQGDTPTQDERRDRTPPATRRSVA